MTELKQFWHLFSTRIVPVLWIIAMICAAIEFGLARLIQRLTQRGALTMPLMMMAVVAAGVLAVVAGSSHAGKRRHIINSPKRCNHA
ncbi:hypothetical protein PZ00_07830 [Lacticaseibacillus rhamnosus]|nr:hypothetical protein PZ00_07830 [Lacticaseibacillus rhamnosus]